MDRGASGELWTGVGGCVEGEEEPPPRCSSQGRCLQAGGGSGPANAAVWTPVIVIREEPRQGVEPLAVGVVRSLVGPLSLHDLVERLRLAIGLRPERPRALQPDIPDAAVSVKMRLT